ncbi:MAG TPA: formimidoylglutamase [Gemmatimonadales bacterium]|nr:formimidoylglutamase [Gemmatimonadales bacterium]
MSADDPRIGELLGRALGPGDRPRAILLGFPSDEGVRRNGGRPGAAEGPAAIRRALARLTPDPRDGADEARALVERTSDLGDVAVTGDVEADQRHLAAALAPWLGDGVFAIVLGGGHETTYGHFLGYVAAGRDVELLNWDAHPDVREPTPAGGHSGSPFRQGLEHPSAPARRYVVAGLAPQSVARAHLAYVRQHGRAVFRDELTPTVVRELLAAARDPTLASFDLDAVDQAAAPGVSAPGVDGLTAAEWLRIAALTGACPAVRSVDLVELNPRYDEDGRTARLAALTVWQLLHGLARR